MKILLSVYVLANSELHFLPVTAISDFIDCFNVWESAGPGLTPVDAGGCVSTFLLFSLFFPLEANKLFCSFFSCQS